jgi:hypothetical protein
MLRDMQKEMTGDIPGIDLPYAATLINRALDKIYKSQRWSFQVQEAGWLTPGLLGGFQAPLGYRSPGTITVKPYATTIVADAVATAFIATLVGRPFITEQQIRVPAYSLYNIIAYDTTTNAPFGTFTLDRPWMEPAQTAAAYMIYQAYFPTGSPTFRKFGSIKDTTNNQYLDHWSKDQAWLARKDAQRVIFDQPYYAIPYKRDARPNSATLGQMMYELWPHPLSILPYSYNYQMDGNPLTKPTDTPPWPITEELILHRAKSLGFNWKESQKGDGMERGSGADWKYLAQESFAEYKLSLKEASLLDVGLGDLYWEKFERTVIASDGYETTLGTINTGNW